MKFSVYQVSRRGGREKNEDRMGYCYTRSAGLFALADGMGGHPEGEVAAQMALQTVAALFQREAKPVLADPARFLQDGIMMAHQQLLRYAADKGLTDTPRTTVVICVLQAGMVWWAHCGDSRLYMVRAGQLLSRTRDHSYSELQEALGRSGGGPERFNRNVLFTCLGSPGKPMIDISGPKPLVAHDRLLLCSDGLWGVLSDAHIAEQLSKRLITDSVPELVEQALRTAGERSDNVTVIALEWEGEDEPEEGDTVITEYLGEEVFASTIQASNHPADGAADLDDAEIDRSVREIQEAIKRAAKKPI